MRFVSIIRENDNRLSAGFAGYSQEQEIYSDPKPNKT